MDLAKKWKNLRILYGATEPKQVTFAITSHCNMVCTTCSFCELPPSDRRHVPLSDAKDAVDFLVDQGVRMIALTGGEPLLHPNFLGLCEYITKKDIMISYISTNGILITDALAKRLATMNVNIVGLSVDVMDPEGRGVTRKIDLRTTIARAKRTLDNYHIDTYAGLLLGKHTPNIKELVTSLHSLGFRKIIFSYPQTVMGSSYLAAKDIDELECDPAFWERVVKDILHVKRWNTHVDIFNTRVNLKEFLSFYTNGQYLFDCPAGRAQFYLDWDLNLYRCLNSSQNFGNIFELKDLNFECPPCRACTQQTHRDYASFYHAFKTVKAMEASLRKLEIRKFIQILRSKKNRQSLNSLLEGYLGGFV